MQPTDDAIADRLRSILQSDEFRPREPDRVLEWLADALRRLLSGFGHLNGPPKVLIEVVCALVVVIVAVRVATLYRDAALKRDRARALESVPESDRSSPGVLLARAHALAEAGLLRDAARALQQALLLQTCRERNVAWRPTLADWEWVQVLHPPQEVIDFTRATQRIAFGPAPSRADVDACMQQVRGLIEARPISPRAGMGEAA